MKALLFSIFDSAAKGFLPPFDAPTVEVAIRMFRATVNQPESQFSKFPEDYTLFQVGEFDHETGFLAATEAPIPLGVAITFLETPRGPLMVQESYDPEAPAPGVSVDALRAAEPLQAVNDG